ncbi:MAG: glycosyltransferase family 4 protein [Beijerinckiaceae bacterium]|nr:glycosyltransferase family 4 protein [Beijerinckiaceae bacterium]
MARLLIEALRRSGHHVEIVSRLRSFSPNPDPDRLSALEEIAAREASTILHDWHAQDRMPDLWISYHPYYKSPDLIGPAIISKTGLPYVTIEASHAGKRSRDGWRAWQSHVERALDCAALNIAITPRDRAGLEAYLGSDDKLALLPPFIDAVTDRRASSSHDHPVRLVTVGMMRAGDKLKSYRFLAAALSELTALAWHLDIIGDGPARAEVEAALASIPAGRVTWHGALPRDQVLECLASADLYLWPGFNEAYGLAYLEAQAAGLPVVALDVGGIGSVVENGRTGLLIAEVGIAEETLRRYRSAIMSLINDQDKRLTFSRAASEFVRSERTVEIAALRLDALLGLVVFARHVGVHA